MQSLFSKKIILLVFFWKFVFWNGYFDTPKKVFGETSQQENEKCRRFIEGTITQVVDGKQVGLVFLSKKEKKGLFLQFSRNVVYLSKQVDFVSCKKYKKVQKISLHPCTTS